MISNLEPLHATFSVCKEDKTVANAGKVENYMSLDILKEKAYTRAEAIVMSGGMTCRSMRPEERYEWLTCQIGKIEAGRFHLLAFGPNWNAALSMLFGDMRN